MREEKKCHCMLFLTEDSPWRGDCQEFVMEIEEEEDDGGMFEVEF